MLEHLVSCVPGVKIALSKCGIKKVQWAENKPPPTIGKLRTGILKQGSYQDFAGRKLTCWEITLTILFLSVQSLVVSA